MTKCDIIFTELYYFLECYWSGCRPIVNLKPKWLNPLKPRNSYYWLITPERQSKNTLSGMEPPSRYSKIYSVRLLDERVNMRIWIEPPSPAGRLYCTVGGDPRTTVMTLKTYLQRTSLHHYSRKSSPVKMQKAYIEFSNQIN